SFQSGDLRFRVTQSPDDRRGVWSSRSVTGKRRLGYIATVLRDRQVYRIDSTLPTRQELPSSVVGYVLPDSMVQSESGAIAALADSLGLHQDNTLVANIATMYDYVTHTMRYVRFSGTTDALTAYRLGEASCGGKSRLMVALARHLGIPARLVGGKILNPGRSTATHIWLELYIGGHWVPFCPTNDYFAEAPPHYLVLYFGEQPFLTHTRDINFRFFFNVKKRLVMAQSPRTAGSHPLDILSIWNIFEQAAISIELLQIILMLPVGVLVVVFARNLLGLETFGTFMPALIAVGFRETGLLNGLALFAMIITFGSLVRWCINRFQLLHTPRLAIILTSVIVFMLGMTTIGIAFGMSQFARVALFPLVILTLTVERFSLITEEYGPWRAVTIALMTMIVTSAAYLVMSSRSLQAIVVSFPEILLVVVALFLYAGRFSGFRAMEFIRFGDLLRRLGERGTP
ncbi:MAG: 7TM domain-containing protein, partial [Candidatus Thorarchaeota archaeon]